jgi:hypothetical protein
MPTPNSIEPNTTRHLRGVSDELPVHRSGPTLATLFEWANVVVVLERVAITDSLASMRTGPA